VGAGGVISNLTSVLPMLCYYYRGGGCVSNASSAFSVNPAQTPAAPTAGQLQPTCATATGSFRLQAILHPIPILSHQV
jgi:hypothetical protein